MSGNESGREMNDGLPAIGEVVIDEKGLNKVYRVHGADLGHVEIYRIGSLGFPLHVASVDDAGANAAWTLHNGYPLAPADRDEILRKIAEIWRAGAAE